MVHWWQDPVIEAQLALVYVNTTYFLLGIYTYVFHSW